MSKDNRLIDLVKNGTKLLVFGDFGYKYFLVFEDGKFFIEKYLENEFIDFSEIDEKKAYLALHIFTAV
jgi:hypothetical protein